MSTVYISNDIKHESGSGVPSHTMPRGSKYIDTDTGYEYYNADGATLWIATHKVIKQVYSYNMAGRSGTYDGVTYAASTGITTLFDRWTFQAFDQTTEEAIGFEANLPDTYPDGKDLIVDMYWTVNTDSKTVTWMSMVTGDDGSGNYGDDVDATHIYNDESTSTGWGRLLATATHSGTSYVAGDEVSLVIGRDCQGVGGGADNLNGLAYLRGVTLRHA